MRDVGQVQRIARDLRAALAFALIVATVTVSACDRAAARTPSAAPVAVGQPAPAYDITALDSSRVAFGGPSNDVVLVNVWATWCASCREEFAELERLRSAYAGEGLRVVAVSVDQGADLKVRKFVSAQGSKFPVAHDHAARISSLYGVRGLPATYLIGRDGAIAWTLTGSFLVDSAGLAKALQLALARPAS